MRSFRRALGLLAASAPLALAVACADPELKSELVTEGPPEVTQVNVLSESVVIDDPTHLHLFSPAAVRELLSGFDGRTLAYVGGRYRRLHPRLLARDLVFRGVRPVG